MIKQSIFILTVFVLGGVMMAGLFGCNGEPVGPEEPAAAAPVVEDAVADQQHCPVMEGMQVNRNIYADHDGKRVYFCCAGCIAAFQADPEKYLEKLEALHAADSNPDSAR